MRTILLGIFLIIHLNVNAQDFTVTDSIIVNNETNQAQLTLRFSEELKVPENKADSLPFSFYVLNPRDSISILNSVHTIRNDSSIVEITFSVTPDTYFSAVILDAQNLDGSPLTEPYFINFESYSLENKPAQKSIELENSLVMIPEYTKTYPNTYIFTGVLINRSINVYSSYESFKPDSINKYFQSLYVTTEAQINARYENNIKDYIKAVQSDSISIITYSGLGFQSDSFAVINIGNASAYINKTYKSFYASPQRYYLADSIEFIYSNNSVTTALEIKKTVEKPLNFSILSAYPNPFNPSTQLKIEVTQTSELVLHVYDVLGRKVQSWQTPQRFTIGQHEIALDFSGFASGTYVVELIGTDLLSGVQTRQTTKVSLVK